MKSNYTFYKLLLVFFLAAFADPEISKAQPTAYPFGNEWINYTQTYYKIKVTKDGMHRLDYNYLNNAGLAGADPRKFQLFRKGKEVSIFVNGESDGKLDNTDYLEFYGERNDGKTDVELFKKPEYKVHDYFNFYTDTATYFLTVSANNGKRIATRNTAPNNLNPENWHYQTRLYLETSIYSDGFDLGPAGTALPYGDKAEGFFSEFFGGQATYTVDSLLNLEPSGPNPTVEVALVGTLTRDHDVTVYVVTPSGSERALGTNVKFEAFDHVKLKYPIQVTDINSNGRLNIRIKTNTVVLPGESPDWVRLAYIKVRYPRKNIFNQKKLFISLADSNKVSPSYLIFENTNANTFAYDITDQSNIYRVSGIVSGAQQGFLFDGSASKQRKILFTASSTYSIPAPASTRRFKVFNPNQAGYVIISNKKLTTLVNGTTNPVREYANYRASLAGGKHDTIVFYVDQLYDQFHYGDRSAVAIRRLMLFLLSNGSPKNLFLIGKGIELNTGSGFGSGGRGFRFNPSAYPVFDLVPTGGYPASDIVFTSDFRNDLFYPQVPTGRLAAVNSTEIANYLEKVKMHESLAPNEPWRKNILHLSGGIGIGQQQQFKNYVYNFENVVEGTFLGGNVQTITKLGSSETTSYINVAKEVNSGLSLMTFFGHSSTTISDIDIGFVSNPVNGYNNFGKYPMILLNGCASGNAFISSLNKSFGEDWMLAPRKGAIAFLAHSGIGFTTQLNFYSRNFYDVAFKSPEFYGKPIGLVNKEVVRLTSRINSESYILTAMEMVLQGDPALIIVGPPKPDYAIDATNILIRSATKGETVTAASDKYQVVIPIKNWGKAIDSPLSVSVSLNNEVVLDSVFSTPIYYQDTLYFNFRNSTGKKAGLNQFDIFVDHLDKIDELDEVNNKVSFPYNFPASGARTIFPVEYAIVKDQQVKLVGQATDLLQQNRDYYFEIDTNPTFKSADKQSKIINAGAYPSWKVTLKPNSAPNDSLVYYWRFRFKDIAATEDTIWGESSFRYIPTSLPGWSQSEPGQFTKNTGADISLNANKMWEFAPSRKSIIIKTAGGQIASIFPPYGIFVNGTRDFNGTCGLGNSTILLTVFSDKTLQPYTMPANMASTICGIDPRSFYHFNDLRQAANQEYLRKFLEAVPTGFYVAAVSVNNVPFSTFPDNLKNAFRALGSRLIDDLQTGYPFALIGQKGSTIGTAQETTASSGNPVAPTSQDIELEGEIIARGSEGTITSTMIGPASEWKSLFHTVKTNGAGNDNYQLNVIGFDKTGKNETLLFPNITSANRNFDLSSINAADYPYLQLSLRVIDADDRTAPQLNEWRVNYTVVPEGIVRADTVGSEKYTTLAKDSEKGKIDVKFTYQNISEFDFKTELVARITLIGKNGFIKDVKIKALKSKEAIIIPYTFATGTLEGKYTLRLTVNPQDNNPDLQPEQYYFNNTLDIPFIMGPNLHPVLDVVFDGQHLMDGDIVSPNPNISITLRDEDKYTFIKDPENFDIFIKAPNSTEFTRVNLSGNNVKYFPATEQSDFKLEFNPQNLADGVYTLRVQAKDGAGNSAGFDPYNINFEVINESTVTQFYPYPNPFSSKTRFVFTLTGATIPQDMKIQIMTITGKVVREIMKEELGPIKIGNNISEFAWDGTDEFGDKLANGVYLYRVIMDTGTEEFKRRTTAADKAFKKDYGKLYILR